MVEVSRWVGRRDFDGVYGSTGNYVSGLSYLVIYHVIYMQLHNATFCNDVSNESFIVLVVYASFTFIHWFLQP